MILTAIRYIDALNFDMDGNFQIHQKNKPMDEADMPLSLGAAYYAHEEEYASSLKTFTEDREVHYHALRCYRFLSNG